MRRAVNLLLDAENYEALKKSAHTLGTSVSEIVDEFIERRVAELKGRNPDSNPAMDKKDYEDLKRTHEEIWKRTVRLEKQLEKLGLLDRLNGLAEELGLDFDGMSNVDEVTPKLLDKWDGPESYAHIYITLMEMVREQIQVEDRLREIRNAKRRN